MLCNEESALIGIAVVTKDLDDVIAIASDGASEVCINCDVDFDVACIVEGSIDNRNLNVSVSSWRAIK